MLRFNLPGTHQFNMWYCQIIDPLNYSTERRLFMTNCTLSHLFTSLNTCTDRILNEVDYSIDCKTNLSAFLF